MKRILSFVLVFTLLLSVGANYAKAATPSSSVPSPAPVSAKSAILIERDTGKVLYEQNAHEQLRPASITKIMSLLLISEAIRDGRISLSDEVVCSEHAASMGGSQIYLEPGEKMSVQDMLKSVILSSANDAVVALGEHLAGSETSFVDMMNAKAEELGMSDTHFMNACGLDIDGHVSSAYDIAVMSRALITEWPEIRKYTTIWMDSIRGGEFQLSNTNRLVRSYNGATGLKTGYTSKAGHCLSATAERNGMELICTVLCAPSSAERFDAARSLLDFGFANYAVVDADVGFALSPIPVKLGRQNEAIPLLDGGGKILIDRSKLSGINREVNVVGELEAPVNAGDSLGEIVIRSGDTELARIKVVAAESVERLSLSEVYSRLLNHLLTLE